MKKYIVIGIGILLVIAAIAGALIVVIWDDDGEDNGEEEDRRNLSIKINEVMYDPYGEDAGGEWIELVNTGPSSVEITGWHITNGTGEGDIMLPDVAIPEMAFLVVYLGQGTSDLDFSDGSGTYFTGGTSEFLINREDGVAIYNGSAGEKTIGDFIAWCQDGSCASGLAQGHAVQAGIWEAGTYFDTAFPTGRPMVGGFSIGRDILSTDTDTPGDWDRNGGPDAYYGTPGAANGNAYFSSGDGIKLIQTKANLFLMEWGYDILGANHSLLQEQQTNTAVFTSAIHTLNVNYAGVNETLEGIGNYSWDRVSDSVWKDEISLTLSTGTDDRNFSFTYTRQYTDQDTQLDISEYTECVIGAFELVNASLTDEPPDPLNLTEPGRGEEEEEVEEEVGEEVQYVEEHYITNTSTTIIQTSQTGYTVTSVDERDREYKNEQQVLTFTKNYTLNSDSEIEARTDLSITSDRRDTLFVTTHYTMVTDIGWHRPNDLGELNTTYHTYDIRVGNDSYSLDGDGFFWIDLTGSDRYSVGSDITVTGDNGTFDIGITGFIEVLDVDGMILYKGAMAHTSSSPPKLFCIDGWESVVGGAVCAVAGGLIGLLWVGVGSVIGAGVGAAACGGAGLAIEDATEEDSEKPNIEWEIGDAEVTKEKARVKVVITITDNEELEPGETGYRSHSSNQGKTWRSSGPKKSGIKTYTITKRLGNTKCVPDTRTITITATDTSGNTRTDSKQITIPARDCNPNVKESDPGDGDTSVPVEKDSKIEFCEPMDGNSVAASITIDPSPPPDSLSPGRMGTLLFTYPTLMIWHMILITP